MDGEWGNWTLWSKCNKTCGKGNKTRSRLCDNPVQTGRGTSCNGSHSQTKTCAIQPCPGI